MGLVVDDHDDFMDDCWEQTLDKCEERFSLLTIVDENELLPMFMTVKNETCC